MPPAVDSPVPWQERVREPSPPAEAFGESEKPAHFQSYAVRVTLRLIEVMGTVSLGLSLLVLSQDVRDWLTTMVPLLVVELAGCWRRNHSRLFAVAGPGSVIARSTR
jgi:hypothetical protein